MPTPLVISHCTKWRPLPAYAVRSAGGVPVPTTCSPAPSGPFPATGGPEPGQGFQSWAASGPIILPTTPVSEGPQSAKTKLWSRETQQHLVQTVGVNGQSATSCLKQHAMNQYNGPDLVSGQSNLHTSQVGSAFASQHLSRNTAQHTPYYVYLNPGFSCTDQNYSFSFTWVLTEAGSRSMRKPPS